MILNVRKRAGTLSQQKMQAFGRSDQHFGHTPFLFLSLADLRVAVANADPPAHAQITDHFLHRPADILANARSGVIHKTCKPPAAAVLVVAGMAVDKIDQVAQEDGKCLFRNPSEH